MSVIHWDSTKALKAFRDKPAALAVFWMYASRVNNEGVAWPSLRGLVNDTGWSINTVQEARKWLFEHGALIPVDNYIRPEWRKLPEGQRQQRLNLDRSEYYRSTGYITVNGVTTAMLYHPGHEANPSDVSSGATSDAIQHGRGDTEYTSSVKSKSRSTSTTPKKQKNYAQHDALIDAWSMACGYDVEQMGATLNDGSARQAAEKMLKWKIPATAEEVRRVAILKRRQGTRYEFRYLLDDIPMARAHGHLEASNGETRRGVRPEDSINYFLPPTEETEYTLEAE